MTVIHLAAQMADVDVDDVGQSLEALVPDMFDDHGAREHPAGVEQQIFEERVLF